MDLSALIFVALALAWAVYLIPKALKHHDEVVRARSVERFSHTMRVLARREPVSTRAARLVVTPARQPSAISVETKASSGPVGQASYAARRAAAARATRRRRNVLGLVLVVNAVVATLAATSVIAWPWVAAPVALLVAWLVACRVMVKGERAAAEPARRVAPSSQSQSSSAADFPTSNSLEIVYELPEGELADDLDADADVMPMAEPIAMPVEEPVERSVERSVVGGWDMVPTTLPTYVSKPAARRRTVSTIDLDSTGVWSSGRSDSDSALAREADESQRAAREADEDAAQRATGS